MTAAGIDTSVYKSHTTRVDINDIIGAAGWSKEGTFQKFYNRDIVSNFNFGSALLNASSSVRSLLQGNLIQD